MNLSKALSRIVISAVLISGIPWLSWGIYRYFWNARAYDSKYNIVALVQTGPEKEQLKTSYLAELLNLSLDQPTNLYKFDLYEGKARLLAFPLIQEATLKRIPPGTLYVDYTVRKPIAFLGNATNASLDQEWRLIPFKPFFSPKKLPEILLDLQMKDLKWGDKLDQPAAKLARELLEDLDRFEWRKEINLLRIDTSRVFSVSLGEQQLIVIFEEQQENAEGIPQILTRTLILNPETYQEGLKHYSLLRKEEHDGLKNGAVMIDLRLPKLGYIVESEKGRNSY